MVARSLLVSPPPAGLAPAEAGTDDPAPSAQAASLAVSPGSVLHVPAGYDEAQDENVTNLYYCEHDGTDDNVIDILEVGDGTVRARITGTAVDANYDDGSKPRMRVEAVATFRLSPTLSRSFC